jgi:zinc-binding in reverse transcriptase
MLKNKVLTIDNLQKRGWVMVNMCIMCRAHEESVFQLFDECSFFRQSLYSAFQALSQYKQFIAITEAPDRLYLWTQSSHIPIWIRKIILLASFIIWRERCLRIFTGHCKTVQDWNRNTFLPSDWRLLDHKIAANSILFQINFSISLYAHCWWASIF